MEQQFYRNLEYNFPIELNVDDMKKAIKNLKGNMILKDSKQVVQVVSSVRTIYSTKLYKENDRIYIELTGNGFLYNMVRIIAGTLISHLVLEKIKPNEIKK